MLCQKCGLTPATVHRQSQVYRQVIQEHLCALCAGEGVAAFPPAATDAVNVFPASVEDRRVRFDAAGQRVLHGLVTRLIEWPPPGVGALSIAFGRRKGHTLHLFLAPPARVRLMLPTLEFSAELQERADAFFGADAERLGYQGLHVGWVSDLPADADAIAVQLTRLFTEVFALPPDAELKLHLQELAAAPSAKGFT